MVQKIHPRGVIWVPSSRLMWADHKKNLTAVPSIYKEVHAPGHQRPRHCEGIPVIVSRIMEVTMGQQQ